MLHPLSQLRMIVPSLDELDISDDHLPWAELNNFFVRCRRASEQGISDPSTH